MAMRMCPLVQVPIDPGARIKTPQAQTQRHKETKRHKETEIHREAGRRRETQRDGETDTETP
eukprot:9471566-Alexandrium_andersonii.AAC.1